MFLCLGGRECGGTESSKVNCKVYEAPPWKLAENEKNRKNKLERKESCSERYGLTLKNPVSPLFTKTKSCNYCGAHLGKGDDLNLEEERRIAKVGSSYFCFCNDQCWAKWLPLFCSPLAANGYSLSSPSQSAASERIKQQMSDLQGMTKFSLPIGSRNESKSMRLSSYSREVAEKSQENGKLLEIMQRQIDSMPAYTKII